SMDMARVAGPWREAIGRPEMRRAIQYSLGTAPAEWPSHGRVSVGNVDLCVASARLRFQGEIGGILAGSQRADFPVQTETLLLQVAVNQAAIGLEQAYFRTRHRRTAEEPDRA